MTTSERPLWQRIGLLAGVVGGLALAALSALTGGDERAQQPGGDVIARINGVDLSRADLMRALKAVSAGRRQPLSASDEAAILQRLIEEEVLVQHALELDVARHDPNLRNALVSAVTRDVITRSRAQPVREGDVLAYYAKNRGRFALPARYYVRAFYIPAKEKASQMAAFERALAAKESAKALAERFGSAAPPIPQGLLPLSKLKDYIGSAPAAALEGLTTGHWSDWIDDKGGVWRLYLVNRTAARTPPLASIRTQVEAAYMDARDDAALRRYIDRLKAKATITLAPDAPQ